MQFADPRNDVAFKKIFGDEQHKAILISFLNAILDFKGDKKIAHVDLVSPTQVPKIEEMKLTILDIKAKNEAGEEFIIEMQKRDLYDFTKRSLYYTSKAYVEQLDVSQDYNRLKKVYFIGILNFNMLDNTDYISRHLILNKDTLSHDLKDFEFTFIELNKFTKSLEELNTILDKWMFFLKNATTLDFIPSQYESLPEFTEAFLIATRYQWNKEDMRIYDWVAMKERDEENALRKAKDTALAKGLAEGLEKGLEKGLAEGIEKGLEKGLAEGLEKGKREGEKHAKLAIAQNLLDILDDETIALKTGLSPIDIHHLRT
ncbi:MAG: Rpn family recombination-promoting nuclease/putative transposase [Sulfuricurvum sp.]